MRAGFITPTSALVLWMGACFQEARPHLNPAREPPKKTFNIQHSTLNFQGQKWRARINGIVISLTPGFGPVNCGDGNVQPLQRLSRSVRSR